MNYYYLKLLFIISILYLNNMFSQGGVDVRIIKVDSLNLNHLDKEIKIDFKNTYKTKSDLLGIKSLSTSNTEIFIDKKLVRLKEYNGRGTDFWYFDKAYLELHNYKPNLVFRASKAKIKKITKDSINFEWTIKIHNVKNNFKTNSEVKNIWIQKNLITAILIRKQKRYFKKVGNNNNIV